MVAPDGSGAAVEVHLSQWTLSMETERFDVTQFDDGNRVRLAGLTDYSGAFEGFFNHDEQTLFAAAEQDAAVRMYLYIDDTNLAGYYFYGLGYVSPTITVPVNGPAAISANWSAGGTWGRKAA